MRALRTKGLVRAPRERVFAVLEDGRVANELLPGFLRIEILEAPWLPKPGTRTRLGLTHRGARFELETELAEYRRGRFLLERQVRGPFRSFQHALSLEDHPEGAQLVEVLTYELPLGFLGRLFDCVSLKRDLRTVLATRLQRLREMLEP